MDIFINGLLLFSVIMGLLFFAAHWKPILIFFVIMLTVWEPKFGVPIAFISSFLTMIWFERKNLSTALFVDSMKFSLYITIGAVILGFIIDAMFGGGSGYSACSRGSPAGC